MATKRQLATHVRLGAGALCRTVRHMKALLFSDNPTCRRCRFYRLAPALGREGALERMATEDAAKPKSE